MSFITKLVVFSLAMAGLAYWLSGCFNAPEGLDQRGDIMWAYVASKIAKCLTGFGEKIGLGHRTGLMRKLGELQFLESRKQRYADLRIFKDSFKGVEVLIIEPMNKDPNGPALVWLHGGGWVLGTADMDIDFLEELSKSLNMMIVSVEYRLAPEFLYPIPLEDCFSAVKHFIENAVEHDVDPLRIAIGGISAGGNLAAALSMKIRDSGLTWKNKVQVLLAPCLQAHRFDTPSYLQNEQDDFLSRSDMINYWLWYAFGANGHLLQDDFIHNRHLQIIDPKGHLSPLVDWTPLGTQLPFNPKPSPSPFSSKEAEAEVKRLKGVLTDPLFAPLLSNNLSGLPSTFLATAEFDVLKDDGLLYGRRLIKSQVDTKVVTYKGGFHYLTLWDEKYNISQKVMKDLINYIKVKL